MDLHNLVRIAGKAMRDNSPTLLTAIGVSGTLTTAYLAGRASFKAAHVIRIDDINGPTPEDEMDRFKRRVKLVWRFYVPVATSSFVTIGCIVAASRVSNKRLTAAVSAGALTEKMLLDYKDKVIEKLGASKEQGLRDEIAQAKVNQNPPSREVLMIGTGKVLCHEAHTGRYFQSDMESLRRAENEINFKMIREMWVTLSSFYDIIGLPHTTMSSDYGWDSDRPMELLFSAVMAEDGVPCISFDYNYTKRLA